MKKRMPHDKMLTLRLPESVYAKLDHIADQNYCSLSAVVRNGIRKELYKLILNALACIKI